MKNSDKKFPENDLFQIGEVAKCFDIDRQTILFYEKKGLIKPALVKQSSGYRYYSSEEISNLMLILHLRDSGLSLKEISDYINSGGPAARKVLDIMDKKLDALLAGMEMMRDMSAPKDDFTVFTATFPAMRCFVKEYICSDIEDAKLKVYGSIGEALKKGLNIRKAYDLFAEYPDEIGGETLLHDFRMRVCLPTPQETPVFASDRAPNPSAPPTAKPMPSQEGCYIDYPATNAVYVLHRGDYSDLGKAYLALWDYVKSNSLTPSGALRERYIDSRKEYDNDTDRYVTKIILPVK